MAGTSFRGPSADAVAVLARELESAVGTGPGSSATAVRISQDLFTIASTLRSEGALRRFATDASLPQEAKTGLVQQLFGGKVDDGTLTLLRSAVTRRWTATRDLADAFEHLGVIARVWSTATDGPSQADRLADELFTFAQAVKDNPALRDALSDPVRSIEDKRDLLRGLLDGRALPATIALVEQSLAGTHRTVGAALAQYQKVVAEVHGQSVATVRVAHDLSEADVARLSDVLSRQYGRQVHLNLLVDPAVIGGIRVEIGDDVIDGTVSSRLDDARRRLVG